jgi:hypothetical protein
MSHRTRGDDGRPIPERAPKKRKKRPNLIGNSENRNAYYRLMQAGWSSTSLSFYALHYYGETIAASTFRSYRARKGWPALKTPANVRDAESETLPAGWNPTADHDNPIDVFHERAQLVHLQKLRVALAVAKEVRTGELEPSTRLEVQALDKLLEGVKGDLQLLGMLPGVESEAGEAGAVRDVPAAVGGERPAGELGVPSGLTFGQVVAGLEPAVEASFARQLQEFGLLGNGQVNGSNGHGQVVDGGFGS